MSPSSSGTRVNRLCPKSNIRSFLSRPIFPDTSVSSLSASTRDSSSVCDQTESGTHLNPCFHKFTFFAEDMIYSPERSQPNGSIETQNAQRGHSTLQPLHPRRNKPPGVYGRSEEICSRRPHDGGGCRSADAELRRRPAGRQE